jgi:hypothetical protein
MEATALTHASTAALASIEDLEGQLALLTRIVSDMKVVAKLEQATWPMVGSLNHTRELLNQTLNHWSFVK